MGSVAIICPANGMECGKSFCEVTKFCDELLNNPELSDDDVYIHSKFERGYVISRLKTNDKDGPIGE